MAAQILSLYVLYLGCSAFRFLSSERHYITVSKLRYEVGRAIDGTH
jgi:hypothetical protein